MIICSVQKESFNKEIDTLSKGRNSLLRVGGRLKRADLRYPEKNPVILPGKHHVSVLFICHLHERVENQGHIFTLLDARNA